jgi:hypothetical protein
MDDQFGRDQNRKGDQESDVYFNVMEEGKPTVASSNRA